MEIRCISIIADLSKKPSKDNPFGKRKLMECGRRMYFSGLNFTWECEDNHKRIWPPQEIDNLKTFPNQDPLKIPMVHHELVSYKAFLLYQIHRYSYKPQT